MINYDDMSDWGDSKKKARTPSDMHSGAVLTTKDGKAKVIEYRNSKEVVISFIETGSIASVRADHLRYGRVKDKVRPSVYGVGFMGLGGHAAKSGGKQNPAYVTWVNMLRRCYSAENQKEFPTYVGCTVCKDWHNFQVFAEWYEGNYIDGCQLDKDKLGDSTIYSPETCCFISPQENTQISQAHTVKFVAPSGEAIKINNLSKFCRENGLQQPSMHKVLTGRRNHHKGYTLPPKNDGE